MHVSFVNVNVEALCRQSKLAAKALGALSAQKLQRRLAELFNAENVSELVPTGSRSDHGGFERRKPPGCERGQTL